MILMAGNRRPSLREHVRSLVVVSLLCLLRAAGGAQPPLIEIALSAQQGTTLAPEPAPLVNLNIVVLDAAARPIADAVVAVRHDRSRDARTTGEDGIVNFAVRGSTVVAVTATGYRSKRLDLPPGDHRIHLSTVTAPIPVIAACAGLVRIRRWSVSNASVRWPRDPRTGRPAPKSATGSRVTATCARWCERLPPWIPAGASLARRAGSSSAPRRPAALTWAGTGPMWPHTCPLALRNRPGSGSTWSAAPAHQVRRWAGTARYQGAPTTTGYPCRVCGRTERAHSRLEISLENARFPQAPTARHPFFFSGKDQNGRRLSDQRRPDLRGFW